MSRIIFKERVILVDILAILFGISSWVEINGLWVQTPILVTRLPEGWNLSSYIVVITQLANIGPITYSLLKFKFSLKTIEKPAIHVTLAIGTVACLLLAIFWDRVTDINGSKHSVALLALTASLAIVDCTTSVLYLPFMAHFKSKYLMSYIIGSGLSGLIPSIVSLIQGVGGNPECRNTTSSTNSTLEAAPPEPRFSVEVFFVFLMCMVLVSWIAFILLNFLKSAKKERVVNSKKLSDDTISSDFDESIVATMSSKQNSESYIMEKKQRPNVSKSGFIALLIAQAYVCSLTNGVLPAIQSYSCAPYGNISYHLAVTLSSIANPISCFVAFYVSWHYYKRILPLIVSFGTLCAVYIIITAVNSPTPPLVGYTGGKVLIVLVWIAFSSSSSYARACIAEIMRNTSTGHRALFFCGVFTQIGSALGAITMFVLVNYVDIFQGYNACS